MAAFALAACGGGGSSSRVVPKDATAQHRKPQSIPCTLDSYGYCFTSSRHVQFIRCDQFTSYETGYIVYEIYDSTGDLGPYTITYSGNCTDGTDFSWYPSDPAVTYGDPNLP